VRAVPAIMRQTVRQLKRQKAKGLPLTRRRVARTMARQVRKVLGRSKPCAAAIKRNFRVSRLYKRRRRPRSRRAWRARRRRM